MKRSDRELTLLYLHMNAADIVALADAIRTGGGGARREVPAKEFSSKDPNDWKV